MLCVTLIWVNLTNVAKNQIIEHVTQKLSLNVYTIGHKNGICQFMSLMVGNVGTMFDKTRTITVCCVLLVRTLMTPNVESKINKKN